MQALGTLAQQGGTVRPLADLAQTAAAGLNEPGGLAGHFGGLIDTFRPETLAAMDPDGRRLMIEALLGAGSRWMEE